MENISVQSDKGFVCKEGDNITLRNATLNCEEKTVIQAQNSKNITLDNIRYKPADVFIHVSGERSEIIRVLNSPARNAGKEVALGSGVAAGAVIHK